MNRSAVIDKVKVIVTGGCGFIGHHFVEHLIKNTDWDIIVLDKLSYSSCGFERLRDTGLLGNERLSVFPVDLSNKISNGLIYELGDINYIFHLAADTHVDHSISDPVGVVTNNIMSTLHILEYARKLKNLKLLLYFGTDEVYGEVGDHLFTENERHNPGNPYSASKSGAEQLCVSYTKTFNLPIIRVNVMNVFGERQHVEKFIPKIIFKLLNNQEIDIYTNEEGEIGSRYYIHARNVAAAVLFIIQKGTIGECYNIMGEKEISNLEMVEFIANVLGVDYKHKLSSGIRPGNDFKYGLDGSKLSNLGWELPKDFVNSLTKTINWTIEYKDWLSYYY